MICRPPVQQYCRGHHTALKLATPSLHAPHSIACSESSLGRSPCHYQLGHLNFRQGDLATCKLQWDKLSTCFVGHCLQLTARPRPAPGQVTGWPYTPQHAPGRKVGVEGGQTWERACLRRQTCACGEHAQSRATLHCAALHLFSSV